MSMCFDGIGEVAATFCVEEGTELKAGQAVALVGSGEVGPGTDGDKLCGVVLHVEEDGHAAVQLGGLVEVGYSGDTAPAAGWAVLSVDGEGKVKCAESDGVECLVAAVDEDAMTAVIKL